ncbi:hypothetical protein N7539_008941 [Penicillium diatomitis]|uniref:Uncharacterized protein n=1 Tax=Penicillium diatomitis TaxID=2819901 RepID=A0A9W9WLG1_9EURO|nr:uncharacterized protein N7539_008941 [Penicillium diatomitis]KAJ5469323.1 hypothetical protein N7539_008941 [Penicillium diatomitis]
MTPGALKKDASFVARRASAFINIHRGASDHTLHGQEEEARLGSGESVALTRSLPDWPVLARRGMAFQVEVNVQQQ